MNTVPSPVTANPLLSSSHMTVLRKKTTNMTDDTRSLLRSLPQSFPSSILFIIYRIPRHIASPITIRPKLTFHGSATASRPCHPFPHVLITGAKLSPTAALSTVKSEPVKNVPTAVPIRSGPRKPFMVRKTRNAVLPSTFPALF